MALNVMIDEGTLETKNRIDAGQGDIALNISNKGTFIYNTTKDLTDKTTISGTGTFRLAQSAQINSTFDTFTGRILLDDKVTGHWNKQGARIASNVSGAGTSSVMSLEGTNQILGMTSGTPIRLDRVLIQNMGQNLSVGNVSFENGARMVLSDSASVTLSDIIHISFAQNEIEPILGGTGTYTITNSTKFIINLSQTLLQEKVEQGNFELLLFGDTAQINTASDLDIRKCIEFADFGPYHIELAEPSYTGDTSWNKTGKLILHIESTIPEPITSSLMALGSILMMWKRQRT